jgi:hypothetical protein
MYGFVINPLSDICFANVFIHLVSCLFIPLVISLAVQKQFNLKLFLLYNFSFLALFLVSYTKIANSSVISFFTFIFFLAALHFHVFCLKF